MTLPQTTGRLLGIDFGSKRIGIALSDEGGQFAIPFIVLKNTEKKVQEVVDIARENKVEIIVLGESRNYKGEANAILPETFNLKKDLEKEGFAVYLEPEFMTSMQAERFQGKHDLLDASSAALILQAFLDKKSAQKNDKDMI